MTKCTPSSIQFPGCRGRKVEAEFTGGDITSDAGVLLLREADRALKLTKRIAQSLAEPRRKRSCLHSLPSLLRQRVFGLALGYEDLNDHETLRFDPAFQTALGRDEPLAGKSTLCRFENQADRQSMWAISSALVDVFIESFKSPPKELILDFDSTDDVVHGKQDGRFFHGYYDNYCFLPLYVFCGNHLLAAYLRPSKINNAKHAWAILSLLVKRIRQSWPSVRIIFRSDSGFCRWKMLRWCDRNNVGYVVGLAKNTRLLHMAKEQIDAASVSFKQSGLKQKLFGEVRYAAASWERERRVIVKAEHTAKGSNPRFVVTNLFCNPENMYTTYCARGEMENRIKEQQLYLYSDRTSCHKWWANQFRVLLSGIAYTLLEAIRRLGLVGTQYSQSRCDTIRLKLLKIGGVIVRNTRRVRFYLSSAYPYKKLFQTVLLKFMPT